MGIFPADGPRLINLQILTGLYATAAQNVLIGIVPVGRIAGVHLIRLLLKRVTLVFHGEQLSGVVDGAVAVVVAHRAGEIVIVDRLRWRRSCRRKRAMPRRFFPSPQETGCKTAGATNTSRRLQRHGLIDFQQVVAVERDLGGPDHAVHLLSVVDADDWSVTAGFRKVQAIATAPGVTL